MLNRLFHEQLAGTVFSEADWIIWQMVVDNIGANSLAVEFYGSTHWFKGLKQGFNKDIEFNWN